MSLIIFFAVIAGIAVVWYVITTLMIYYNLKKRKMNVQFVFLNFMAPSYANRYKKITLEETGKIGTLYYHWIISINVALLFGAAAIASKYL